MWRTDHTEVSKHGLHLVASPQTSLKGMGDCMNSEEEFNYTKLKAKARALGTNSKQGRGRWAGGEKKYLTGRKSKSNVGSVSCWKKVSQKSTSKLKDNQLKISRIQSKVQECFI